MELKRQLGLVTALLIIVAEVIGTGIFMTTGQVLEMTGNVALSCSIMVAALITKTMPSLLCSCYSYGGSGNIFL